MNALILAAGYATRLYPLTLKKAKPLLLVGAKPIIEWVVDNLSGVPDLETIYVVTNDKFAADFQAWSEHYRSQHPEFKFKIINDGSTSDEDKLGAIGDINFVISRQNLSQSSLLIVAGDNLLTESLTDFVACARRSDATVAGKSCRIVFRCPVEHFERRRFSARRQRGARSFPRVRHERPPGHRPARFHAGRANFATSPRRRELPFSTINRKGEAPKPSSRAGN